MDRSEHQLRDIDDEFISLRDALDNRIMGQKRTGRGKQLVILGCKIVWKGPYLNRNKVTSLLNRSEWLKYWNSPLIVHPVSVVDTPDGQFVNFPNVDRTKYIEWDWNQESFTDWRYRVLKRKSLLKLNHALAENSWIYGQYGRQMLTSLIHLWILKTGDTGLANMMADIENQKVHIIDYEETRSAPIENSMFYFSKPAGKIHQWYENMGCYYRVVAGDIGKMLNDPFNEPHFDRIIQAIRSLLKYAPTDSHKSGTGMPEVRKFRFSKPRETHQRPPIGQMVWSGPFGGSTTYSGLPLDEAKSGLQKYIRRGMVEKALQCAFEMWRMVEVDGKSAQSNMYNRLATIAAEDIGVADPDLVLHVVDYVINQVHKNTDRSASYLATVVQRLANSRKTRLMSHLWRTYVTDEGKSYARTHNIQVDDIVIEDHSSDTELSSKLERFFRPGDPEELIPLARMFYHRLSQKSYLCIGWAARYVELAKGKKVKVRRRRTNPVIILWEMMREYLPDESIDILSKAYFTLSEKRPQLMMAISLILFYPEPRYVNIGEEIRTGVQAWESSDYLTSLRTGKYELVLDDYVIDKHTKRGSLRGRTRKDFVQEGAKVENEDPRFRIAVLEDVYLNS
jgi:hypothetical protein